ncbi:phospholipase D family protein [Deinococcus sp. ME38]|uniref:phospholipase D family protein n=1 Tax=Deinococcus sp. ME38 TaxID=3400344 RepID=UPI003B5C95E0
MTERLTQTRWEGWGAGLSLLEQRPGTLWVVSPFITASLPAHLVSGARVLTTLDPVDLARGSSQATALAALMDGGAEVRTLPDLHAKVYLRMHASQAVGFSGSANLTQRGNHRNLEAMTGPEEFSIPFIRDLMGHWSRATPLTQARLLEAQARGERLRENFLTQEMIESDVVVIMVDSRMLRGMFELTESKVGIPIADRTPGLRPARVEFVTARARKTGLDQLRIGLQQLQDGQAGRAVKLSGGLAYAVPIADRDHFQDRIERLHHELRDTMAALVAANASAWKEDFMGRLRQAASTYLKADPERVDHVVQEAGARFDQYLAQLDVGLSYGTYLPLQTPSRALAHDFRTYFRSVRENQTLEWDLT